MCMSSYVYTHKIIIVQFKCIVCVEARSFFSTHAKARYVCIYVVQLVCVGLMTTLVHTAVYGQPLFICSVEKRGQ